MCFHIMTKQPAAIVLRVAGFEQVRRAEKLADGCVWEIVGRKKQAPEPSTDVDRSNPSGPHVGKEVSSDVTGCCPARSWCVANPAANIFARSFRPT